MEAAEVASKLQTCDGPTSLSEESRLALSGKNKRRKVCFITNDVK